MSATLDLWPTGNCQVSALVDRSGCMVWACVPAVYGDPPFSSSLGGDDQEGGFSAIDLDAGVIQLLDLRFIALDELRFACMLSAIEAGLRRGSHMLRYATGDDFGLPEMALNGRNFWLTEALHLTGRTAEARRPYEEVLMRFASAGLLSEDIAPASGELWGNYPHTYSLFGLINCAVLLSKPWTGVQ